MKRFASSVGVVLALCLLTLPGPAFSATNIGPFSYSGQGTNDLAPFDFATWSGPVVSDSKTQWMSFYLDIGNSISTNGINKQGQTAATHLAFGLRGHADRDLPGIVLGNGESAGRGLAIGYLSSLTNCADPQIAIENFTTSTIIPGTCRSLTLHGGTQYRVDIHASLNNIYWAIFEIIPPEPGFPGATIGVASGGCNESSGAPCPEHANDTNGGDIFVASAFTRSNMTWNVWNLKSGFINP